MATAEPGGFTRRPPRHRRLGDEQRQRRKYNLKASMCSVNDEDLRAIVQKALNSSEPPKIASRRVENYSANRHGIMGDHYVLTVEVEEPGTSVARKLQFFVKTPPESTSLRDSLVDEWVSLEEVHFFDEVYPELMRDYRGPRWCAECYLAKPDLLVFQDLRSEGYSVLENGIFDEASLESAISALARFHASSIVAEARLGKPLDRVYSGAFREKIFTDVGKGGRANRLAFDTVRLLAEKFQLAASALVPDILQRLCQLVKPVQGDCNVICHGDLWRSNLMFSASSNDCLLVDFQMLRYAAPSVDLAVLLCVHASPEFRASSEPRMLRHYYSALRAACCETTRIPCSYEDFSRDYESRKLVGLACACTRWPKFVFHEVMNDPAALRRWYFESRMDVYEAAIERDPNYARITRDCLAEFLDAGERALNL